MLALRSHASAARAVLSTTDGGRNSTAATTAAAQPRMSGNRSPTTRYANAFSTNAATTRYEPFYGAGPDPADRGAALTSASRT